MYAGSGGGQKSSNGKSKGGGKSGKSKTAKPKSDITCYNCGKVGHVKADCWAEGGDKAGQGPHQKSTKKGSGKDAKKEESANATTTEKAEAFAFSCTSDFTELASLLSVPKSRLGAIVDSGATRHFCPDKSKFSNFVPTSNRPVRTADGNTLQATGTGDIEITLPNGAKQSTVILKDALCAPGLAFTLISVSCLLKVGCGVNFLGNMCTIRYPNKRVMATIPESMGLFRSLSGGEPQADYANVALTRMTLFEAHRKLGHLAYAAVKNMISTGMVEGIELDPNSKEEFCEACAKAKSARQPYPHESTTRAENYGERVHWDLWGPATVKSLGGKSYAAARKDDATREVNIYFQEKKSETFETYKKDEAWIRTQKGNPIKWARMDRGGEFMSKEFIKHHEEQGTQRELTVHDSPPQNGVSERGMRTRAEATRALLLSSRLPRSLWAEAMLHSVWLQNRSPTRALNGKTPFEMVNGRKPYLGGIQEFGAAAYVKDLQAGKLDPRAQKGRFVGYDSVSKGYRIYWPEKRTVSIERNVVFNPNDLQAENDSVVVQDDVLNEGEQGKVIQNEPKGGDIKNDENRENNKKRDIPADEHAPEPQEHDNDTNATSIQPPKRSRRQEIDAEPEPNTGRGFRVRPVPGTYARMHEGLEPARANIAIVDDDVDGLEPAGIDFGDGFAFVASMGNEPASLDEALSGAHAREWQAAWDKEMSRLEAAHTWELVIPPAGVSIIPCREVFKEKTGPNGEITERRLRVVAGGHKQQKGIDYDETFSSAAKMPTVRVMLADAAQRDWEIHQVDVKSAYLNAPLEEVVYMHPPKKYLKPGQEGMVCRLLKCLYGLKQAGRGWHKEMSSAFEQIGFSKSGVDHSLFIRRTPIEQTAVAVATDDMAVAGSTTDAIKRFKTEISEFFDITDGGEISWFLNFEIRRDRAARTISINQRSYLEAMASKFGQQDAKPVYLPMLPGEIFSKDQCPVTPSQHFAMRKIPYAEGIGHVLWPVMVTRPDALCAVGILAQFVQNPGMVHWNALMRVIAYLNTTKDYWLTFGQGANQLEGYSDADWASQTHRHSISGYTFRMGDGAVTWSSKKQAIVALSSTEAEYVAQTHAAKELIWLRTIIGELNSPFENPTTLHCDNQGAIALAKDNKFHARTKHIDIRYHFIREAVEDGSINMQYIPTNENIADIFTKPLAKAKFERFVQMLGLGYA